MTRGLAEEALLDREGRLVARLAAQALDRVEEGRLLAADVGAGAAADLDVEGEALAQDVGPEQARGARRGDGASSALGRQRVLAPDVDVAALAAGGVGRDGHRLDEGEGVLLHEDTVLEGPGLGLVGVADEVVRARRLLATASHLRPAGKGGAAAALELRGERPRGSRPRVRARRPAGAPRSRRARGSRRGSRDRRGRRGAGDAGRRARRVLRLRGGGEPARLTPSRQLPLRPKGGEGWREGGIVTSVRGRDDVIGSRPRPRTEPGRRRALAEPEARRRPHACLARAACPSEFASSSAGAARQPAGDVVAHVHDRLRLRLDREHRVERRDAVGVGRRDGEALADVVERAGRDPADARLGGPERREQQMPARARRVAADGDVAFRLRARVRRRPSRWSGGRHASTAARSTAPARHRGSADDRHARRPGWQSRHGRTSANGRSVRTAGNYRGYEPRRSARDDGRTRADLLDPDRAALNSAVPDLGSIASIVRMFVATSSWKWSVMNARPGRSVSS